MSSKGLAREKVLHVLSETLDDAFLEKHFPGHSPAELRQLITGKKDRIAVPANKVFAQGTDTATGTREITLGCKLYTDGASRGNPGEAGAGAVLYDKGNQELLSASRYLGVCTNNVAEYQALLIGLEQALQFGCSELEIFLDSELIVRQIEGRYKVKNENLKPLYQKVQSELSRLKKWSISHVARAQNCRADSLANKGIDEKRFQR